MVSFPPCKINLGLYIQSKRSDGYHSILTCFYPVPWTDILEVLPADSFSFTQTGLSLQGKSEDNLCVKAHETLKKDHRLSPLRIHLHKIIPAGAGLGGGSSDAAYTLVTINKVCGLGLSEKQLSAYAATIGSDCAYFISGQPRIGRGRGDELEPATLHLKGHYLVLVKPDIHISTAEAYAGVVSRIAPVNLAEVLSGPVDSWRDHLNNDFEDSVFKKHPAISKLKEQLYNDGAIYASMSGSGSSVYGIFKKEVDSSRYSQGNISWSGWL